jgi:bifunctional non-homologous end joining protein LigD
MSPRNLSLGLIAASEFCVQSVHLRSMKIPRIEGSTRLASFIRPMLAEHSSRPAFTDSKWIFEIKWDGYRAVAEINSNEPNRLYSRNGTSYNKAFPRIYSELSKLKAPAVLDGEIVVYDENGKPSFQLLQNYSSRQKHAIQFQVFDILSYEGKDLCKLPLLDRKAILKKILPESDLIRYCDHVETEGEMLFEQAVALDLEGIIAKRAGSKYSIGSRSKDWLKIKNQKFDEFIIVGFLHSDKVTFKSLVIADIQDGALQYRGNVSGFTDQVMEQIYKMLTPTVVTVKPLTKHEKFDSPVSWVKPQYICNVRYTEITDAGILRNPVFKGLVVEKKTKTKASG